MNMKKDISNFTFIMAILSFVLLLVILILIVVVPSPLKNGNSLSVVLSVMGTIITGLGFVTGLFFIFLAVDAYSEVQEIKKIKEEAKQLKNEHEKMSKEMAGSMLELKNEHERMSKEMAGSMLDFLSTQLSASANFRLPNKTIKKIRAERARFVLNKKHFDDYRRINIIREFQAVGTERDIDVLQKVLNDPTESEKIKEMVEQVIGALKKKFES